MPIPDNAGHFRDFTQAIFASLEEIKKERSALDIKFDELKTSVHKIETDIALIRQDAQRNDAAITKVDTLERRVAHLELEGARNSGRQAVMGSLGGLVGAIVVFVVQYLLQNAGMKAK